MNPIETLTRSMTEDEVFESMLDILETLEIPARAWRKGNALRVFIRVCARLYAGFTVVMAAFIASGFLESAEGEWLTKLAKNVYGVDRRPATTAREKIRMTNTGGGLYAGNAIGTITVLNPITKKAYRNTTVFTLNPLETLDVEFEAVEVGAASASAPGTITDLETILTGVVVTNPKSFVGLDDEDDATLRQACRDKLGILSVRGPRSAYAYAVRVATRDDGSPVNINRSAVSTSSSKGEVHVWVASPGGAPVVEDVEAVAASIETIARPDTVKVYTAAVTEVPISRNLTVWVKRRDGIRAADVESAILTEFVHEAADYPIGGIAKAPATQGKLYSDWFSGVAKQAWPDVYDVDGAGADTNLAPGEVAVLTLTVAVRLQGTV